MIGYLRGTVRGPELVDVNGVGYVVHCPVPLAVGDETELHVHTAVREDAIVLYGFTDEVSRTVFAALVKVSGVGPSIGLALLSGLGTSGVVAAIQSRDAKALSSARGVGAKVAEKIVSLCALPDLAVSSDPRVGELAVILTGLGWSRPVALSAAEQAWSELGADADEAAVTARALLLARDDAA